MFARSGIKTMRYTSEKKKRLSAKKKKPIVFCAYS
jgi:hypothetical protein